MQKIWKVSPQLKCHIWIDTYEYDTYEIDTYEYDTNEYTYEYTYEYDTYEKVSLRLNVWHNMWL